MTNNKKFYRQSKKPPVKNTKNENKTRQTKQKVRMTDRLERWVVTSQLVNQQQQWLTDSDWQMIKSMNSVPLKWLNQTTTSMTTQTHSLSHPILPQFVCIYARPLPSPSSSAHIDISTWQVSLFMIKSSISCCSGQSISGGMIQTTT